SSPSSSLIHLSNSLLPRTPQRTNGLGASRSARSSASAPSSVGERPPAPSQHSTHKVLPQYLLPTPDEQLQSLLLLRIQHPAPDTPADPTSPPLLLLEFLN